MKSKLKKIFEELFHHIPYTGFGAFIGTIVVAILVIASPKYEIREAIFELSHMSHVFFSALATGGLYKIKNLKADWFKVVVVGIVGSIVIGTLSDCLIPALGLQLMGIGPIEIHAGIIHHPVLILLLATVGSLVAYFIPRIKFPHLMHVTISTMASAFHMLLQKGLIDLKIIGTLMIILFIAVWLPCCLSDIVFPIICTMEDKE